MERNGATAVRSEDDQKRIGRDTDSARVVTMAPPESSDTSLALHEETTSQNEHSGEGIIET